MSALTLSKKLIRAWQTEGSHALEAHGVVGKELAETIDEALVLGCLQETLIHAAMMGLDPRAVGILNREGERKAGVHFWDPQHHGREDTECFLLACPCSGDAIGFNQWLNAPGNVDKLKGILLQQIALLTRLEDEKLEALEVLPALLPPPLIAQITAEARRSLLLELCKGGEGKVRETLLDKALPAQSDPEGPVRLTEGVLLIAVVAKTHWGKELRADAQEENWAAELAQGEVDPDFLKQAQALWSEKTQPLGLPSLAQLSQPVSVNEALMDTLHAGLTTLRLNMLPAEVLEETAAAGQTVRLPHVYQLTVSAEDSRTLRMDILTEYGQVVAKLSSDWAMVEGEEAFHAALARSLDINLDEANHQAWDKDKAPADIVGDHPAWDQALPTPPGIN